MPSPALPREKDLPRQGIGEFLCRNSDEKWSPLPDRPRLPNLACRRSPPNLIRPFRNHPPPQRLENLLGCSKLPSARSPQEERRKPIR